MQRILAADLTRHLGETVRLAGWLHQIRRLGGVSFLLLRDRSGTSQIVIDDQSELERLAGLQVETVLEVTGKVVGEPRARLGVEVRSPTIKVLSAVVDVPPFELNKKTLSPGLEVFLDNAAVGLRHPLKQATFRLGAGLLGAFAAYFTSRGFVQIRTPKLVAAATEGGANLFAVQYFERYAYLAQSPQLYKQMMVGVFERVFEIGPAFRAEPHYTTRHINEFTSIDAEIGFVDDLSELTEALTDCLRSVLEHVRRENSADLSFLGALLPDLGNIPTIRFRSAQQLLLDRFSLDCRGEPDLAPEHERLLGQYAREEHGSDFLYVTHYPTGKRPFYTLPEPADPGLSQSFDLLFRGAELVTGGLRVNNYQQLVTGMTERGIDPTGFAGYLQAFKYGMPPEGGFAIGYERLLARLVGLDNIREATLFPRDVNRLRP